MTTIISQCHHLYRQVAETSVETTFYCGYCGRTMTKPRTNKGEE